jgi:hypothetical protein
VGTGVHTGTVPLLVPVRMLLATGIVDLIRGSSYDASPGPPAVPASVSEVAVPMRDSEVAAQSARPMVGVQWVRVMGKP